MRNEALDSRYTARLSHSSDKCDTSLHRLRPVITIAAFFWLAVAILASVRAGELPVTQTFQARDTLAVAEDPVADAAACLRGLVWQPASFPVTCRTEPGAAYDFLVQFPTPISSGDAVNDRVSLEWYAPRDELGAIRKAPPCWWSTNPAVRCRSDGCSPAAFKRPACTAS